jgi:hypothetical protein
MNEILQWIILAGLVLGLIAHDHPIYWRRR